MVGTGRNAGQRERKFIHGGHCVPPGRRQCCGKRNLTGLLHHRRLQILPASDPVYREPERHQYQTREQAFEQRLPRAVTWSTDIPTAPAHAQ